MILINIDDWNSTAAHKIGEDNTETGLGGDETRESSIGCLILDISRLIDSILCTHESIFIRSPLINANKLCTLVDYNIIKSC